MRRIIAFVLMFACLVSLFVVYTAAADADGSTDAGNPEGEYRRVNLTETSVMEDLKAVEEQQKGQTGGFKISDYPAVPFSKKFVFLALTEDFRIDSNARREYGLYLYLYNPGRLKVETDIPKLQNFLQMSVDGVNVGHYAKYPLQLVSYSEDKLFYKFYVTVPDGFARKLSVSQRTYNISGIEIAAKYDSNVAIRDHSGAADGSVRQTISIRYIKHTPSICEQIAGDDLLHLDVNMAYYRVTNGDDLNKYKQLMVAWFELPKKYINYDGTTNLTYINYECEKLGDQIVMVDTGLNCLFNRGKRFYDNGGEFLYPYYVNDPIRELTVVAEYYKYNKGGLVSQSDYYEYRVFSGNYINSNFSKIYNVADGRKISRLVSDYKINIIVPTQYGSTPSSASLFSLMNDYENYSYYYMDGYRQIGGNIDLNDESKYYNSTSYKEATNNFIGFFTRCKDYGFKKAFQSFNGGDVEDSKLSDLELFRVVNENDYNLNRQDFIKRYKVDERYVDDLRKAMIKAKENNAVICLFRYDLADYEILADGRCFYDKGFWGVKDHEHQFTTVEYTFAGKTEKITCGKNNTPKFYKMPIYKDFDILDLTFGTQGDYKIVPVNADPVKFFAADIVDKDDLKPDIIPPSRAPIENNVFGRFPLIIAGIVLIVAVALIVPLSRASGKVYNGISKAGKSVEAYAKKMDQKIRRKKKKKK